MSEIIEVDYGLASVYSDGIIEINRKIQGPLRDKMIRHEQAHSQTNGYTVQDYKTDFQSKAPYLLESLLFCFYNPEGFINFMPLLYSYYRKQWTFNWTAIFPFVIWGAMFVGLAWLLFRPNPLYLALAWINLIILLNIALLLYTHIHVRKVR